jgi:hypothetical protein
VTAQARERVPNEPPAVIARPKSLSAVFIRRVPAPPRGRPRRPGSARAGQPLPGRRLLHEGRHPDADRIGAWSASTAHGSPARQTEADLAFCTRALKAPAGFWWWWGLVVARPVGVVVSVCGGGCGAGCVMHDVT